MLRQISAHADNGDAQVRGQPAQQTQRMASPCYLSPGGKHILLENGPGGLISLSRHSDCVGDVVGGGAGRDGAAVLEVVACAADPAERPEGSHGRAELSQDRFLNRDVPAAARSPQALHGQQADGALTQRLIRKLIGTGQIFR